MLKLIPLLFLSACATNEIPNNCVHSEEIELTVFMGCVERSKETYQCLKAAEKLSTICYDETKVIQ